MTLGTTEEVRLAQDAELADTGLYSTIYKSLQQHGYELGQYPTTSFVGYGALQQIAQNGMIRACVQTVSDDITREWIQITGSDDAEKVDELQKGIRAAESISDHITLRAGVGYFELSCEGDTDSVSLRLEGDAIESINAESDVQSMFPLDYFSNIVKAIPAGTVVRVELDNDYPVKLVFALADGQVKVNYLLAPRIESD